jgi:hypothetical protein
MSNKLLKYFVSCVIKETITKWSESPGFRTLFGQGAAEVEDFKKRKWPGKARLAKITNDDEEPIQKGD